MGQSVPTSLHPRHMRLLPHTCFCCPVPYRLPTMNKAGCIRDQQRTPASCSHIHPSDQQPHDSHLLQHDALRHGRTTQGVSLHVGDGVSLVPCLQQAEPQS